MSDVIVKIDNGGSLSGVVSSPGLKIESKTIGSGPRGIQGEKGEQGDIGPQGPQGAPGYTPIKGVDYFDGATGPKGDPGPSNLVISATDPQLENGLWIQKLPNGNITIWLESGE